MTLTDFLLARITEDEAAALSALGGQFTLTCPDELYGVDALAALGWVDHIVRFAPDRVLDQCEAYRRIVENCENARRAADAEPFSERVKSSDGPVAAYWRGQNWTLKILAAIYADHPDYREEWRA